MECDCITFIVFSKEGRRFSVPTHYIEGIEDEEDADIYQVIHGDYSNPVYTWKPLTHPRIKKYIC